MIPLLPDLYALLDARRADGRIVPIGYHGARLRIVRSAAKAGVEGVHAHLFRHSWASLALKSGMDSMTVQQLGGWSSTDMLKHYTRSVQQSVAVSAAHAADLTGTILHPATATPGTNGHGPHASIEANGSAASEPDVDLAAALADPRTRALMLAFVRGLMVGAA